ncbi:mRNA 3' end processing factor [Friedmanniomyces endolithicus]|nr:mRNA 3' end processing factor [Friedmanniomyces endolithicus]KAK0769147.1 mRNA 3' end processing factor [Friedmanniomyces endolithicus]KAK0771516.1 mRNA 3' end processing factor [Friedmanniomyces endolithicus]KAK0773777.1 mRNA 3' end processing factor [Friedmanniomyces endolithicus]KAK0825764.1 mRNA 3' end processing factor [Friedmanniomyces endolithicus]
MSARSPRGSLSGSSDVAVDFADSLKDLQQNNRYEIGNLTTIARESTEHAQAISKALEVHIKTTAPNRKLPSLYVLDSIIKNVGTPYTVYLGRNLYGTFMEAYTLVDGATRRAMESLLKTWKEPVPGSIDPRPVFPLETVRPIENALIRAKTAALQDQRHAQPQQMYQGVPTPLQYNGRMAAPSMLPPYQQQPLYGYEAQPATPQQQQYQPYYPPPTPQHSQSTYAPVPQPPVDVGMLKADISSLISRLQARFAANTSDQSLITQLKALLDLQTIVNAGVVTGSSSQEVRNKVTALAASAPPVLAPTPQPMPSTPQWQPPQPAPLQYQAPSPVPQQYQYQPPQSVALPFMQQPAPATPLAVPSISAPGALNDLQALLMNGNKPSTPQMRAAAPVLQHTPHSQLNSMQNNVAAAPPTSTADLLAALSKSGVLASLPKSTVTPSISVPVVNVSPPTNSTASLLQSLQSFLPPSQQGTPTLRTAQMAGLRKPRIPMTAASLKTFRPELVRALYEDQPNQCSTCGRRFLATEDGRAKKERHLDWHFRTNQRMADPNTSRGQHRQWFVDEVEWISIAEFDPSTASAADAAEGAVAKKLKQKGPADQYLRAPAGITRLTCSVCQEEMKSSFSDDLQDWVFTNAVYYNGKPAHATCVEEMKKPMLGGAGALATALAAAGQRQRSATPESALGKRKAEGALAGQGARVKTG